ncbi:MFS transporter [Facklamia lactis]|uniref:MFS transporter n=1 Tax=Facklamia lactis TaxID=2749967 RepID=UPI0018CCE00D|nr:MFS transporter [Facklamia lactis]MBG9981127.1 MFS transporter [Facklamia lactis]
METHKNYPNYWKTIVATFTAGWMVIWIYRVVLTPIYPEISEYFGGITDNALGAISSYYFLGYVIMQIPSGILVDKLGKRKVLIPGFLIFGLGALIVALSKSIGVLYIGSVLAGIGCGTYYGVAYSLTSEYVPADKKSLATAIVNSGTALGSGIGLIASSYLVGNGYIQWQWLLYVVVFLVALMILVYMKVIKSENSKAERHDIGENNSDNANVSPGNFKSLFTLPMISTYLLYFSTLYTYYLIDTWLPNFLETERGIEGTAVGVAASLVFFMGVPGALLFSYLADKFPTKKIAIIISLELLAAGMLFMTIKTNSLTVMIVGIILYGFFGKLAVEPIIIAWLSQFISKGKVATAYGVFNFFGMSSSVIVPSLTGFISDSTGSKIGAFYLAIIIIILGTSIFYFINRTYSKKVLSHD